MADVAAEVGVSRQLVGLALRNQQGVSGRTRAKILEAADRLGYQSNIAAQTLRQASTKLIGAVFHPNHSAALGIVEWLHGAAEEAGYTVVVSTATSQHNTARAIRELVGYRCEAVVLIAPEETADAIRKAAGPTPVVIVGRDPGDWGFDTVRSTGEAGIRRIVEHLISIGHRDIAFVHETGVLEADSRLSGYLAEMESAKLPSRVIQVDEEITEEAGATGVRILLASRETLPTALACNNDQAAHGAMHELRRQGLRVPEEVSVTGYDDSYLAGLSFVDLTTARQDPEAMGRAVIQTAVTRIVDDPAERIEAFIDTPLVIRGSTVPPRRD